MAMTEAREIPDEDDVYRVANERAAVNSQVEPEEIGAWYFQTQEDDPCLSVYWSACLLAEEARIRTRYKDGRDAGRGEHQRVLALGAGDVRKYTPFEVRHDPSPGGEELKENPAHACIEPWDASQHENFTHARRQLIDLAKRAGWAAVPD